MKTELEKMLAGELYFSNDKRIQKLQHKQRLLQEKYNLTSNKKYLKKLMQKDVSTLTIRAPVYFDYGFNTEFGENVYFNYGCVILDVCKVRIGNNTMFGPMVQIYTASHPLNYETRNKGLEMGKPITIGSNCWIGGGAIILPGVNIGNNCIIGAGSVVTKDIPDDSIAYGNPAKIRPNSKSETTTPRS